MLVSPNLQFFFLNPHHFFLSKFEVGFLIYCDIYTLLYTHKERKFFLRKHFDVLFSLFSFL